MCLLSLSLRLGRSLPDHQFLTVVGLAGAVVLGVAGLSRVGWALVPFLVIGPLLVVAYNLELFGGLKFTTTLVSP